MVQPAQNEESSPEQLGVRTRGATGNTQEKPTPKTPQLSETEQELKWSSYRATAVIETSTVLQSDRT